MANGIFGDIEFELSVQPGTKNDTLLTGYGQDKKTG